jgi:hypothetical protein
MYGVLTLSLKITNWCDLNCAHCCECSGANNPTNFMPLTRAEQYISEFQEIPYHIMQHYTISGGEGLAPYQFGNLEYIPTVLSCIYKIGGIPTIKTNGVWGERYNTRTEILKSLAGSAYFGNKLLTLDISVDEFHNNLKGVANIVADVVQSDYLLPAIRICLVGFNTDGTRRNMEKLRTQLDDRELHSEILPNHDWAVYRDDGKGMRVVVDDEQEVHDLGRAKQNNVYTATGNPVGAYVNCLSIDNNYLATLNYLYTEQIAGRKLKDVMNSLLRQIEQNGK